MSEPKRLLEGSDTPQALRQAVRALQLQAPDAMVHARISARLAAPHALRAPAAARGWQRALLGLALLGAALVVWRAWPQPRNLTADTVAEAPAEVATQPRAPVATRAAALRAPRPAEAPVAPNEAVIEVAPAPLAAPGLAGPRAAPRARAPRAVTSRPAPAPAIAVELAAPNEAPETAAPALVEPASSVVAKQEPPELAEPQDEASLLYRARRLAGSDPRAALRLIVLHEASFPNGSFGEERDMLEIQIHERLGHRALAQRLVARFRARYPSSVYRTGVR